MKQNIDDTNEIHSDLKNEINEIEGNINVSVHKINCLCILREIPK